MLLEVASAAGGVAAGVTVAHLSDATLERGFAAIAALIAVLMLTRLERRNVIEDATVDPVRSVADFTMKNATVTSSIGCAVCPSRLACLFFAGNVSAAFGIGGGILKVPVLTAWCGIPMRVAAATSSLMIGVTAVASVPIQYANGYVNPPLAGAAVLGVLLGSRGGLWFGARARAKWLKLLMAVVLMLVA